MPTIKRSVSLTLWDRLSRLNFEQACKLLGPRAKKLIMQGAGAWDIDIDSQVKLTNSRFRVDFGSVDDGRASYVTVNLRDDVKHDGASWTALLAWRSRVDAVLARLHAPVTPAFADVGADATTLMAYKADIQHRFGMSVEALSNDRYDGYLQFATLSHLPELGRHLSQQRFYLGGKLSACDLVLACDLFPLQLLDGVTLPMDLLYYIERVEKACGASLRDGLIMQH